MALNIKNAQDITNPRVHVFLYGASGSGKTTAASKFPSPLFLVPANEQSIVTLRGEDFNYIEIGTQRSKAKKCWQEMEEILDELLTIQKTKGADALPCETVVVESLSHYIDMMIEDMTNGGEIDMTYKHWGLIGTHLRHVQDMLRQLDVHAVFTSLAKVTASDTGSISHGGPMLTGQSAEKLPSACDIIGYCDMRPGKPPIYTTHFQKNGVFFARTRFKEMPASVQNFCWEHVEPYLTKPEKTQPKTQTQVKKGK